MDKRNLRHYVVSENLNIKFNCGFCDKIHSQKVPLKYSVLFNRSAPDIKSVLAYLERKMISSNTKKFEFIFSNGLDIALPPVCIN
jgi:hypothetical protein